MCLSLGGKSELNIVVPTERGIWGSPLPQPSDFASDVVATKFGRRRIKTFPGKIVILHLFDIKQRLLLLVKILEKSVDKNLQLFDNFLSTF